MAGISLTQTGGAGLINGAGAQNPAVFSSVITGIPCVLAGVGATPVTWSLGGGSTSVLSSTTAASPSFTPDIAGNYEVVMVDGSAVVYTLQLVVSKVAVSTFTGPIQPAHIASSAVATPAVGVTLWSDSATVNAPSVKFTDATTAPLAVIRSGATASRPAAGLYVGFTFYDTTLGVPIWWNGTNWKNSVGTTV